jgi:FtsH-binding integral membrane protein
MDSSTLYPFLCFAVFLVSHSIDFHAYAKLTHVQQEAAKTVQSIVPWFLVPFIAALGLVFWFGDKIEPLVWMKLLCALALAVPMSIVFTWENRRLRSKDLPSSYLKERLMSQAVLLGGGLSLILLW